MRTVSLERQKLENIIKLLKFITTVDDPEILNSTVESVIETLEDLL